MVETELTEYFEKIKNINSQIEFLCIQKSMIYDKLERLKINCPYCKYFHKLSQRGASFCVKTGSFKSEDYPKCFAEKGENHE